MRLSEFDNKLNLYITETGSKPYSAAMNAHDWIEVYKDASQIAIVPIVSIKKSIGAIVLVNGIRVYPDPDIEYGCIRWEEK